MTDNAPTLPTWLARMLPATLRRRRVSIGPMSMHICEQGQGRPVLLLHGNPTWSFLYRKVFAELAGEPLRLIAPDLIGLGLSDKPREGSRHTLEGHARWLGTLVDTLDLRDVILVVQDWGGPIGLRAFAERPERLAGMVILNTVVGPPRPGFRPTAFHRFARAPLVSDVAFRLLGFPQSGLHRVQGDPSSIRGDVARAYRWPLRRFVDRAAPLALARMVPDTLEHPSVPGLVRCDALLRSFEGPLGIVWGDRDPILGSVVRHLERTLPHAEVVRTPAGHFLQEEVPETIAAAITRIAAAADIVGRG